jgi:ribosomal protein S18 acetylase RimI-like enzyme
MSHDRATISVLQDADIEAAVTLWEKTHLTRPWNDPHADARRALSAPCSTILAAHQSGTLVGTVMVGHDGHRGWVYYLAVAPHCQHHNIGSQLMQAAEAWLRPHVPKVMILVRRDNSAAQGFYERLGYEVSDVAVLQRNLV